MRTTPKTRLTLTSLEAREVPAIFAHFDWSMEERFGQDRSREVLVPDPNDSGLMVRRTLPADGLIDIWNDPAFVQATKFNVTFTADSRSTDSPVASHSWIISKTGLPTIHRSGPSVTVPLAQGEHTVGLVSRNAAGEVSTQVQTVNVRDLLIVSMGDSYASGEGNPDVFRTATAPARWADSPGSGESHRSGKSAAAQAALAIEKADPHTSVTFVSVARSGDGIYDGLLRHRGTTMRDLLQPDQWSIPKFEEMPPVARDALRTALQWIPGADAVFETPYGGESQISQAKTIVGNRRIDALTLSIGGNDSGFVPVLTDLLTQDVPKGSKAMAELDKQFEAATDKLAERYEELHDALLDTFNLQAKNILLTEYPDPTRDANGGFSKAIFTDLLPTQFGFSISPAELEWAGTRAVTLLNGAVGKAAARHGWTFVDGVAAATEKNGLGAGAQSFFNDHHASRRQQEPNTAAAAAGLNAAAAAARAVLRHPEFLSRVPNPALWRQVADLSDFDLARTLDNMSANGTAHPNAAGWELMGDYLRESLHETLGTAGRVAVYGTEGRDLIEIRRQTANRYGMSFYTGQYEVVVNDVVRAVGKWADTADLRVYAGDGNDDLTLNDSTLADSRVVRLYGQDGNDDFLLKAGTAAWVVGGDGIDKLDYSGDTHGVYVNLTTNLEATRAVRLSGIESALGGDGNDILVGDSGDNGLFGGAGMDILIGGAGKDTLKGGLGDDVLLADITPAASDEATLRAARTAWTTTYQTFTTATGQTFQSPISRAIREARVKALLPRTDDGLADLLLGVEVGDLQL